MAEDSGLCTYEKHHKQKILLFLSSMRSFCDELKEKKFEVIYKKIEDNDFELDYLEKLKIIITEKKIETVSVFEIEDKPFEKTFLSDLEDIVSVNYLNTMPSKRVINQNRKGNLAADNLRLKRIDTIERTLNDLVVKFNNHFEVLEKNIEKNDNNMSEDYSDNEVISNEEFYTRSRRIFFGFIFSISIIFLLIIVSTGINIFI